MTWQPHTAIGRGNSADRKPRRRRDPHARVRVTLDPEHHADLKAAARKQGIPLAELIDWVMTQAIGSDLHWAGYDDDE